MGALCDDPVWRLPVGLRTSDVCLSRTSGLSREQRGLGRLKLAQRSLTSHVTRTPLSRSKGQMSSSPVRIGWLFKSPLISTPTVYMPPCHHHHIKFVDRPRLAQGEPRPVDLHKVATCTGRGHSVAAALQTARIVYSFNFFTMFFFSVIAAIQI